MKVLFLSEEFPPTNIGGSGVMAYNLAKELKSRGHDVFVITPVEDKSSQGEFEFDGVKIFRIYANYHPRWQAYLSLYNPQTVPKIKKILKEIRPDIVHAHNIHHYLSYYCLKIAKKYAKAVFLTAHDAMLVNYGKVMPKNGPHHQNFGVGVNKISIWDQIKEAKKRYNPFRNLVIRHYLKYVDKIFAVSNALKKVLEVNGIKNIETVYNGIDIEDWEVDPTDIRKFKDKYSLQNKRIILFGGRLSGAKGGEVILRAMSLVTKAMKDAVLLVAGEKDWYAEKMIKLATELGISKSVIFTGWFHREEMKWAFFASDICVTPSIYLDPFNLLNIEAGAAKKPVVGTCFGGTGEIVVDNQTGYIVNPLNVEKMAEKILDLLKNPEKAKKFGEAGYKRVGEKFSLEKQIEETLGYYQKFIN